VELKRTFLALGIALGLGLLVGMQRERAGKRTAGSRTFPLITLLGAVTAVLAGPVGGWIVGAGMLGVVATLVVGNLVDRQQAAEHPGMTTEVAMLVMFGVGALCVLAPWEIATAVGGTVLVLLHVKEPLHRLAGRLGEDDVEAIVRFALISLVVLPVLPDRTYGPYEVLNPRQAWFVVVLVVAIGLAAYIAQRTLGPSRGALVGGLLGGLVSSTATTASAARRVRQGGDLRAAVLMTTLASAMVFPRQLVEIGAVAPRVLPAVAVPLGLTFAAFLLPVFWLLRRNTRGEAPPGPGGGNPAELGPAVVFGLSFSAILFVVAFAEAEFGSRGLYLVAVLSGLADVDAITISTASLFEGGRLEAGPTWRTILVASLSNLGFKLGIAGALGGLPMLRAVGLAFAPPLLIGAGCLLLAG
jgi:uncharacterized membrane protein (DUF4010 family)